MTDWPKGATWWNDGKLTFLSVPFTWDLPKAAEVANKLDHQVIAGGPAVKLLPDYLPSKCSNVIACIGDLDALSHINPDATFTTRGCIRQCFPAGTTLIMGNGGAVPIETIRVGDRILGMDIVSGKVRLQSVQAHWIAGTNRDIVKIETINGRILECTLGQRL